MTFLYRKVRARSFEDANDIEARLNAHLVTDFTLKMSDVGRQLGSGQEKEISVIENPSKAYEFQVLYKSLEELGRVKDGSWLAFLMKRGSLPKTRSPTEAELIISCKPELVLPIDQFLIDEPYALLENREVDEARYSFSTGRHSDPRSANQVEHGSLLQLGSWIKERSSERGLSVKYQILNKEADYYNCYTLTGNITGYIDHVVEMSKDMRREAKVRMHPIRSEGMEFFKSSHLKLEGKK